MKLFIIGISVLLFSSCSTVTEISYRQNNKSEYIKECGYILSCKFELNSLIITTYTSNTWGDFYYQELGGIHCVKDDLKIKSINIDFPETNDKLNIEKVSDKNEFYFVSKDLQNILKRNKEIRVSVIHSENGNDINAIYILKRHRHSYITGGKIFGC